MDVASVIETMIAVDGKHVTLGTLHAAMIPLEQGDLRVYRVPPRMTQPCTVKEALRPRCGLDENRSPRHGPLCLFVQNLNLSGFEGET